MFNLHVDPAVIGGFLLEVVVGNCIVVEVAEFEAHELAPSHWCIQVEILDVDCHEWCVGRGDDAVEEEFDCEEVNCGSSAVSRVVDAIAANGEASAIWICLLWPVVNNYAAVGDIAPAVDWDILFGDEEDVVGAVG